MPLEVTGDRDRPVAVRPDADGDYKVGTGHLWPLGGGTLNPGPWSHTRTRTPPSAFASRYISIGEPGAWRPALISDSCATRGK